MNRRFVRRIYFPRMILLVSALAPAVVEFLILVALTLGTLAYYYFAQGTWYLSQGTQLLLLPLPVLLSVLLAWSVGLWTSFPAAKARDVRFGMRYVLRVGFFLSPVIYPVSAIPEKWHWLVWANPMTGILENFKYAALGIGTWSPASLVQSGLFILVVMVPGLWWFYRCERLAADSL